MIGSLIDGFIEIFWELGDEDKNKIKNIIINCVKGINVRYVFVYVDNFRDLGVRREFSFWFINFFKLKVLVLGEFFN